MIAERQRAVADDLPERMTTSEGAVYAMPYALELNDVLIYAIEKHESQVFYERFRDTVEVFDRELATQPRILTLALHPNIIAQPHRLLATVRGAVATGEYASSSEVIRDALRDWTHKRSLRQQGVAELRAVWQEALADKTPGVAVDEVLGRLERKYQAIADAGDSAT